MQDRHHRHQPGVGSGPGQTLCRPRRRHRRRRQARDLENAVELTTVAADANNRVQTLPLDVSDAKSVQALARSLGAGKVDVLIDDAGVSGKHQDLEGLDLDDCAQTFATNVLGPLHVLQRLACGPRRGRRVLNIFLAHGLHRQQRTGSSTAMASVEGRADMATETALELAPRGVCVVAVHPSWVQTRMGGAPGAPQRGPVHGRHRAAGGRSPRCLRAVR